MSAQADRRPRDAGRAGFVAPDGTQWLALAACRGRPTGLWFPAPDDRVSGLVAARVCATCPVRAECAAYAVGLLDERQAVVGVWAGVQVGAARGDRDRLRMIARRSR